MKFVRKVLPLILLLCMSLLSFSQDWGNLEKYKDKNQELIKSSCEVPVVFMGNSITEGWKNFDATFFTDNHYINRGISGQTTPQMLFRYRQDVINLHPKVVVILAGINDIAENTGPISIEMIADNIRSMIELSQANDIEVLLCSVLPANTFSWSDIEPADKVIELNKILHEISKEYEIHYVNYYDVMVDDNKGLKATYGDDGVHPNGVGYDVMKKILKPFIDSLIE